MQRWLEADPRIKDDGVTFVSKAEALEIMRDRSPELVEDLTYNPLPDAFEIQPQRAEDVEAIAADLRAQTFAGVEKVDYGRATARRIIRVGQVISIIFFGVVLLLLAASGLLIANTIRLSIYARRREIEVMKLVGASNWFVRGPFMLEGLFTGFAGALLAVILLLLGKEIALPAILGRVDADSDVQALAFAWTALILLGLGLLLGAAGSGLDATSLPARLGTRARATRSTSSVPASQPNAFAMHAALSSWSWSGSTRSPDATVDLEGTGQEHA